MELSSALSTPDPTDFLCRMPVHQDGTCNGLQHYAALGRDIQGGLAVNVIPDEIPQDIYMAVLREVERRVREDFKKLLIGSDVGTCFFFQMIEISSSQLDHPHYDKVQVILEKSMLVRKVRSCCCHTTQMSCSSGGKNNSNDDLLRCNGNGC